MGTRCGRTDLKDSSCSRTDWCQHRRGRQRRRGYLRGAYEDRRVVALVRAHEPGARDRALVDLAEWNSDYLRQAADGLGDLRRRVPPGILNDTLLRGAVLHTDLALLAPDLTHRSWGSRIRGTLHALEATDGHGLRLERRIGALAPGARLEGAASSRRRPRVRAWSRAVGASLLAYRRYAAALPHLREAQRLFPRDRDVNMLSGLLHESFAAAASQELLGDAQATSTRQQARCRPRVGT